MTISFLCCLCDVLNIYFFVKQNIVHKLQQQQTQEQSKKRGKLKDLFSPDFGIDADAIEI